MKRTAVNKLVLAGVLIVSALTWMASPAAGAQTVSSVSGGAFGLRVRATLDPPGSPPPSTISAGPVPSVTLPSNGGGPFTASLASANVPPVISTGLLEVRTQGATGPSGFAESSATVATVNVLSGGVTADAVQSQCRADTTGATGSTTIVNGQALGIPIAANPGPNTVIVVGGVGSITLNEQIKGPGNSITVNAVHIRLNALAGTLTGDVIIAQSRCRANLQELTFVFTEPPGGAGGLPANAAEVRGEGSLVAIRGVLGDLQDMYAICIDSPSAFSATTVGTNTAFDSQLFLFDSSGAGEYANDDAGGTVQSRLPANHPSGPTSPGRYYLAISKFDRDPVDANGNRIFPNTKTGVVNEIDNDPIADWVGSPPPAPQNYTIRITGARGVPC
jgi:hypothetical protein